jgi:hypothetical protein
VILYPGSFQQAGKTYGFDGAQFANLMAYRVMHVQSVGLSLTTSLLIFCKAITSGPIRFLERQRGKIISSSVEDATLPKAIS